MSREELANYIKTAQCGRQIKYLIVHCTATRANVVANVRVIDEWHKARDFHKQRMSGHYCGYHFVIAQDGSIEVGRYLNEIGAHTPNYNTPSIGICYAGGLDAQGRPADTRTPEQKAALEWLLTQLVARFPNIQKIAGHRDFSPDKNGNGIIDKWEYLKDCPCFNAIPEYKHILKK
jgi:N-acetyl-anhydromuramyl-L-alanine amidase AmpD|nr:MAG TPA: endodeoxyribonuclease I [Caudoviricetes sp.]